MGSFDQVWIKALLLPRKVQAAQGPVQVAAYPIHLAYSPHQSCTTTPVTPSRLRAYTCTVL